MNIEFKDIELYFFVYAARSHIIKLQQAGREMF